MAETKYINIGYIIKPHGVKGELQAVLEVDEPESYEDLESLFLDIKGTYVPYFVENIRISNEKVLLRLEGIDTFEEAEKLRKASICLPEDEFAEDDQPDQPTWEELVDFAVDDKTLGFLGEVVTFYDYPSQVLMEIVHKGRNLLIPFHEDFILEIDREKELILLDLPEGFLEASM